MKHIDETRLEKDTVYRFQYLAEFIGFTDDDVKAVHGGAALLAPLVPVLVDAVYQKLQQYDATWRHFLPRQQGYAGPTPAALADLTPDHPQIQFRKQHLGHYLTRLVTAPYDGKMAQHLDHVGRMHTAQTGNQQIHVPLVQMNALMGFVADAVNGVILAADLPANDKALAIRAFSKLLWIQNDLITRHYTAPTHATQAEPTVTTSN